MDEKVQDVGVRIQKYVVAVWWYRGDILSPYGTQFFVFETEKGAIKFARDEDRSLRRRYDFNWLNAGYRFWENHILVTVTNEFGDVKYGWLLFTHSEEEVREMCPGKGYDPEVVIAERRKRSQQKSFDFNTRFIEEDVVEVQRPNVEILWNADEVQGVDTNVFRQAVTEFGNQWLEENR